MDNQFMAKATIKINALISKVWDAIINPKAIKEYMFGTNVISEWKEGNKINHINTSQPVNKLNDTIFFSDPNRLQKEVGEEPQTSDRQKLIISDSSSTFIP